MVERTELETERLLLRPFRFGDEADVLAYCSEPGFARFLPHLPQPYTVRDAAEFVANRALDSWEVQPYFAITLGGRVIGGLDFRVEPEHQRAGLGYGISPAAWGHGYTPEAASAAIGWAFTSYGLARVFATANAANRQSWRVMEKLGMRREALLRSHRVLRGERADEVVYGILREEWLGR